MSSIVIQIQDFADQWYSDPKSVGETESLGSYHDSDLCRPDSGYLGQKVT